MHQTSPLRHWCEGRLNSSIHRHSKHTYTNIHEDTASVHPQPHPRHSRGSQAQRGLPWRPVYCALFPLCTVPPQLKGSQHTHTHTHTHAHTGTHMHHKYLHVYTYTCTHIVYYQTSQQSCNYCPVDSAFLYKVKECIIHLNLFMCVDKLFFSLLLDVCLFINTAQ